MENSERELRMNEIWYQKQKIFDFLRAFWAFATPSSYWQHFCATPTLKNLFQTLARVPTPLSVDNSRRPILMRKRIWKFINSQILKLPKMLKKVGRICWKFLLPFFHCGMEWKWKWESERNLSFPLRFRFHFFFCADARYSWRTLWDSSKKNVNQIRQIQRVQKVLFSHYKLQKFHLFTFMSASWNWAFARYRNKWEKYISHVELLFRVFLRGKENSCRLSFRHTFWHDKHEISKLISVEGMRAWLTQHSSRGNDKR